MKQTHKANTTWVAALSLATSVLIAAPSQADLIIETISDWNGSSVFNTIGEPSFATVGQTFIAPSVENIFQSFTFFVNDLVNPEFYTFEAFVMEWDVALFRATGPVLFTSAITTTNNNSGADGIEQFTFSPGLALTPGTSYVAFYSSSNLFNGTTGQAGLGLTSVDSYSGGDFVLLNNGSNFGLVTSNTWSTFFNLDVAFEMTFVPSPGALGLLAVAGLCGGRRRRRHT